jgi:hypothetical protein
MLNAVLVVAVRFCLPESADLVSDLHYVGSTVGIVYGHRNAIQVAILRPSAIAGAIVFDGHRVSAALTGRAAITRVTGA